MPEIKQTEPNIVQKMDKEQFRARANSSPLNKNTLHVYDNPTLTRCDRSENDLDSSFTGGMASVENSWIDKRALSHRYLFLCICANVLSDTCIFRHQTLLYVALQMMYYQLI